ncbi:hypothetical protein [Natronorubrum sp. DTA28]|uniref:hypothetical protein n=1 Tax=Natronorubrum sp. DTA28 TaxID=3447019 RepID=UPI003F8350EC
MKHRPGASRRRFLAGTTGVSVSLLAGCSSVIGVLPDRVVYARARRRSVPEVETAVETTDAHLRTTAEEIASYATDGLEAWNRLDEPSDRQSVSRHRRYRIDLERAAEFADDLPTEPPVIDTVEAAGYRLSRAAAGFAYAQAKNADFDRDPSEKATVLLDEVDAATDRFSYETGDPETFLAYGHRIEYCLNQAGQALRWRADDDVEHWKQPDDAEEIADSYAGVRRSELRLAEASAYREALRERDGGGDSVHETIAESQRVLRERVDDLRDDRARWFDRIDEFDGERRSVHDALYSRSNRSGTGVRYVDRGFEVYGTVELAKTWLLFETARAERDRLEDGEAAELDAASIDAAKRDAVDLLEDALASSPGPSTEYFLAEARGRVSAGDSGIERRSRDDDEDREWSRANGYARYLLGKGMVERTPDAIGLLTGAEDTLE